MTDPSGRAPVPQALLSMAQEVAEAMGRFHPGRPAFSALSRAEGALRQAAQEVEIARRTYAPDAHALSTASRSPSPVVGRGRGEG